MPQAFRNIRIGLFIAFVNLLIQGISFFVQNFIARTLDTANFGYFGILQTDYTIFTAIADFGMATLILAFFAERATRGRLFRHVLQTRLLCALATGLCMAGFACTVRTGHPVFKGELILILGLVFQHGFFDWYFISGRFWKKLLASKILHSISYSAIMALALFYFRVDTIEEIALAMVVSALPAFFFGVTQVFHCNVLHVTRRTFRFTYLMLKAAVPYALSSLASFAYLPAGLYAADLFAPAEFLGRYFYGHKLILLASGLMVHFISSNLITLHSTQDNRVHLRDNLVFTLFIALCAVPFLVFPDDALKILFFAVQWTPDDLAGAAACLRVLSCSLLFQAFRMTPISQLLKEKRTWTYGLFVCIGGAANVAACLGVGKLVSCEAIPMAALSGDLVITAVIYAFFARRGRLHW